MLAGEVDKQSGATGPDEVADIDYEPGPQELTKPHFPGTERHHHQCVPSKELGAAQDDQDQPQAEHQASEKPAQPKWKGKRLVLDESDAAAQEDGFRISIPWWSFVALRAPLFDIFRGYELAPERDIVVSADAAVHLRQSKRNADSYVTAREANNVPEAQLRQTLRERGFVRDLSAEQARNVSKIASLPAAATFSVPGAGKTTEALAYFFYRASATDRLLVVAPKNAFAAWDEQINDCVPELRAAFVRLRGGKDNILKLLEADPRFMIVSYQQLARIPEVIAAHCAQLKTYVFLDESHRIKSGTGKQTARAALSLAHLPIGKLVMSGTPMPQSTEDLIPQLAFLYPELVTHTDNVIEFIKPIYVRTNKKELGLPPVTRQLVQLSMAPMQAELYKLMKFEVAREAASALGVRSKQAFRSLGRSVARLLQFVSNPALLSSEIGFAHPELLAAVLSEGDGPKLKYLFKRARTLARENEKILIWSSFVRNVEYVATRLSDLGAVYIHGGVDAGDENDDDTREGKIKLFHDDPNVRVMVANPAAASEGGLAGTLHLTRNEWERSLEADSHIFHLWSFVSNNPGDLAIVSPKEMESHVPRDSGDGSWEMVEIPFAAFRDRFASPSYTGR